MGQWYSYSTKCEKNTVAILHVYGARGIFLLFYNDQDTAYEWWEIQMSTFQVIFTYKTISKDLWENDTYTLQKTLIPK